MSCQMTRSRDQVIINIDMQKNVYIYILVIIIYNKKINSGSRSVKIFICKIMVCGDKMSLQKQKVIYISWSKLYNRLIVLFYNLNIKPGSKSSQIFIFKKKLYIISPSLLCSRSIILFHDKKIKLNTSLSRILL